MLTEIDTYDGVTIFYESFKSRTGFGQFVAKLPKVLGLKERTLKSNTLSKLRTAIRASGKDRATSEKVKGLGVVIYCWPKTKGGKLNYGSKRKRWFSGTISARRFIDDGRSSHRANFEFAVKVKGHSRPWRVAQTMHDEMLLIGTPAQAEKLAKQLNDLDDRKVKAGEAMAAKVRKHKKLFRLDSVALINEAAKL